MQGQIEPSPKIPVECGVLEEHAQGHPCREKTARCAGTSRLHARARAQEIDATRPTIAAFARDMQESALATVASADKRSVDDLLNADGAIAEACEQCHKHF
ncbi:MAG: hypothetical protein ABIT36_01170 [Steroidobacteraceae bacterium]